LYNIGKEKDKKNLIKKIASKSLAN